MKKTVLVLIAAALLLFTGACDETRTDDGQGRLVINVTDGPFDISDIESATVTIRVSFVISSPLSLSG